MSLARGIGLFKALNTISNRQLTGQFTQVRSSHGPFMYRRGFNHLHTKTTKVLTQCIGGFMWWWILWHLWHQFDHLIGEFPYPDPSAWTDEELGIPPDDFEE